MASGAQMRIFVKIQRRSGLSKSVFDGFHFTCQKFRCLTYVLSI